MPSQGSSLSNILDKKVLRMLEVFYRNKSQFYHITHLAKESKVPSPTVLRTLPRLVTSGLIKSSTVGKIKIYCFNETDQNNNLMRLLNL